MAGNYRLRRFSNPATLKSISQTLLLEFLDPYRPFLIDRGLTIVGDGLDYDLLTSILASPDESTPEAMLDALFFLDELAVPHYFDDLMSEAQAAGIEVGNDDDVTSAESYRDDLGKSSYRCAVFAGSACSGWRTRK